MDRMDFEPKNIRISSQILSLNQVIERIRQKKMDMRTNFKRKEDLWDGLKGSRLIESILIQFPLPTFYFDGSNDDQWLIFDGFQRLTVIKKFVIDNDFKLKNLEFLEHLNGKKFIDLERSIQRKLYEFQISAHIILPDTPETVKKSIFHRINAGGMSLNHEIK